MKRIKYVITLLFVIILIVIGIFITNKRNTINHSIQDSNTKDSVQIQNVIRDTIFPPNLKVKDSTSVHKAYDVSIPSKWKEYTSKELGITFKYPETWTKYGEESKVAGRLGNIVAIEVNFIDSLTTTSLLVSYHLPPEGKKLYDYAISQHESSKGWYEKDSKLIEIAGNKAVEANADMKISGKGALLDPPLKLILVDFLDKEKTGAIQLQFKTPLPECNAETAKFQQLLSSLKFSE